MILLIFLAFQLGLAAQIVTSPFGGTVERVYVHAGDRVSKGQLLITLHAGELQDRASRTLDAFDKAPLPTLDRAAAMIARLPPQTWIRLVATDPERAAVETEYAAALAAHEYAPTRETKHRLQTALANLEILRTHVVHRDLFDRLVQSHHDRADDVAWLKQQLKGGEVRSSVDGTIAIFDLRPGDRIAPQGRLMLIETDR